MSKTVTMSLEEYDKDLRDAVESGKIQLLSYDPLAILNMLAEHYKSYDKDPNYSYGYARLKEIRVLRDTLQTLRTSQAHPYKQPVFAGIIEEDASPKEDPPRGRGPGIGGPGGRIFD